MKNTVGSASESAQGPKRFVLDRDALALLACIGFGLLLAWKHLNISPTLFDPSVRSAVADLRYGGLEVAPFYVLALLVLGLLAWRGIKLPERPIALISSMLIGACVISLYALENMSQETTIIVGGLCSIFSSILLLYWAKLLCDIIPGGALCHASIAFGVCFGVALLATFAPEPIAITMHVLLPVASGVILAVLITRARAVVDVKATNINGSTSKMPIRLFFGIAIISTCIDLTNVLSEVRTDTPNELCLLVVGLIVSLTVLAIASEKEMSDLSSSFKVVLVVILVSMLAVLVFEFEQRIYETAALALGGCLFRIFFYAIIFEAVRRLEGNRLCVLAICIAIVSSTQFLFPYVYKLAGVADLSAVSVVSAMTICSVVTTLFVLDEKYVTRLLTDKLVYLDINDEFACRRCVTIAAREHGLTNREEQIALQVLQRKENTEIAEALFIAPSTLQVHLRNIHKKMGVHSRSELIEYLESLADA